MSSISLGREQYTVGWICALAIETAVARGMLDAEHSPVPRMNNDHNSYVLGSIAQHNVVIACLPSGSYGTTSAAIVATNLLSSFPNVRFGLLVGVGGGVPSEEHDVRLGDVVVSHPDGTFGGVVQFDLGKDMLRSLIWQLYCRCKNDQQALDSIFAKHDGKETKPTTKELATLLLNMARGKVHVILDALDECEDRRKLLPWIRDLASLTELRLILTSRMESDIEVALEKWIPAESILPIQNDLIDKDICVYIRDRVQNTPGFERWSGRKDVQDEIQEKLMLKADGMFRWAACQLDALEKCTDRLLIRKALENLPATLDDTYTRILRAIPVEYKGNATRILQLLSYSDHPLEMLEVVDALAVDLDSTPAFDAANRMPRPEEIIAFCSSLVTLNIQTKNVQLAHFSVRQYLFSDSVESPWKENLVDVVAKVSLARVCLAYCSSIQQDFNPDEHVGNTIVIGKAIEAAFPFGRYASMNWSLHASKVEEHSENLRAAILDFFLTRGQSFMNWMYLANFGPDERGDLDDTEALNWTSYEGLAVSAKILLSRGVDVNSESESGTYSYALTAAAASDHEKIVAMLLETGANVDAADPVNEKTALACAAEGGYKTIVGMLLRHGADTCVWANRDSVLDLAISGGDEDIVKMLLGQDLPGLIRDGSYAEGVLTAAEYPREEILQLLLRQTSGCDQTSPQTYSLALQRASEHGYRGIVEILLERATTIDATTLCRAVYGGHESTVELLLDYDANIDDKALYTAVIVGHEGIVRILLENGATIETKVVYAAMHQASVSSEELLLRPAGDLPLYLKPFLGSSSDFKRILQILTKRAVSDNLIHRASLLGDDSIVLKLLDAGADVHRREAYYGNALQAASVEGHSKVVEMLLEAGADVNAEGGAYGNALQAASLRGYDAAWELQEDKLQEDESEEDEPEEDESEEDELEEDELEEDKLPKDGWSEMEWILYIQKRKIRGLPPLPKPRKSIMLEGELRGRNRDGKRREKKSCKAEYYSQDYSVLFRDHTKVVTMLLAAGADPNAQGGRYGNALQAALSAGDGWILYRLKGGDPGPLQRRYFTIRDEIVEILVDAGATTTPEADEIVSRLRSSQRFRAWK